jgi:hypothetical protein
MVGSNEKIGTHVVGVWDVTNASNSDLVLLKARLKRYPNKSVAVGVRYRDDRAYEPKRPLSAPRMARVMIDTVFQPPIHAPGKALIADVIFTDNYADEHIAPSVLFRRGNAAHKRHHAVLETLHKLTDGRVSSKKAGR